MKSTVSFMKSRCLCVKMVKTPHIHDSSYDHNKCPFFPYGSHLLHNALNQVRPFASSSSQAVPYGRTTITRHKGKEAKRNGAKPERCSSCVLWGGGAAPSPRCPPPALEYLCGPMMKAGYNKDGTKRKNKKKKTKKKKKKRKKKKNDDDDNNNSNSNSNNNNKNNNNNISKK